MTTDYKLANVVLRVDAHAEHHPELYYRAQHGVVRYNSEAEALEVTGEADFLTYINGLSAGKWYKYTELTAVTLRIAVSGSGEVHLVGVPEGEDAACEIASRTVDALESPVTLEIPFELTGYDLIGFVLDPHQDSSLKMFEASWRAEVEEDRIRPISLAIATTTFNNERYILPNIELVKSGISAESGPISRNFHMFVVDNGRTLNVEELSDELVTVLPNPNAGGSGGFARGMMAATETPGTFTHVIVMDDDVRIMPESIIRVYNLLSLARGRYRDAFVNGAMLSLEDPTRQYEDVGRVVENGVYRRIKKDIDAGTLEGMLKNERTDVEIPRAYGAWWFSCIPVSAIEKNGLPMPFFIRCDDVEFGMRNRPIYMTMDGICVWHASFEGRFRPSVDCYQYTRNFMTMIAVDGCASEQKFVLRFKRSIRLALRDLDYVAAELTLDGFEDYLKGPEFLAHVDGSLLMKENGAKNEKLLPVDELDADVLARAGVTQEVLANVDYAFHPQPFMKVWRFLPYDKHYLPNALLRRTPSYVVKNGETTLEGSSVRSRVLVYLDPTREKGIVRQMDRERFRAIRKREAELMKRYRREGANVRAAYKSALPYLTSREFWASYLGLCQ